MQSQSLITSSSSIFPHRAVIMAKKELRFTPLGPYLAMSGAVMVDRGNSAKAVESLRAAGSLLHERQTSLWMFPEGTRTTSERPALRPFKKGAFHLAVTSGVPIIPVVCENTWKVYRDGAFEPGVLKIRGTSRTGRYYGTEALILCSKSCHRLTRRV